MLSKIHFYMNKELPDSSINTHALKGISSLRATFVVVVFFPTDFSQTKYVNRQQVQLVKRITE